MSDDDKKIIVDEDWKTQVERERAEADAGPESAGHGDLPPASFEMLVSSFAAQAMAAMGQLADPNTGKPMPIRMDIAKLQIDLLEVLDAKTKSNLDDDEQKMLTETLHNMRMIYVACQQATGQGE